MATLTIGKFFSSVFLSAYLFLIAESLQPELSDWFNDVPAEQIIKKNARRETNRIRALLVVNTSIGAILILKYFAELLIKIEELKQIKKKRNEKDIKFDSPRESDNKNP